jgi:hypothetical protein
LFGCTGKGGMNVIVNGLEPGFDALLNPAGSGVWWFDIDALGFVGQPLNITLRADTTNCPDGATFSATMAAQIVKK